MDQSDGAPETAAAEVQPGAVAEDPTTANPARVYNALLGGTANYAADREVAARLAAAKPALLANVRANRAFLKRVTRWLPGHLASGQRR